MYCPQCGQERVSDATSFCSRCGYLLTGTADLMATGGAVPERSPGGPRSPRSRGIRMGIFMFLLTFVFAPVVGLISVAIGIEPWPVGIVVSLLGLGGILRIIYALMFESKDPFAWRATRDLSGSIAPAQTNALPPQRDIPAAEYVSPGSAWREPEIRNPGSVTDTTTKLLQKNDQDRGFGIDQKY